MLPLPYRLSLACTLALSSLRASLVRSFVRSFTTSIVTPTREPRDCQGPIVACIISLEGAADALVHPARSP